MKSNKLNQLGPKKLSNFKSSEINNELEKRLRELEKKSGIHFNI